MKNLVLTLWNDPKAAAKFITALIGAVVVAVSVGLLPDSAGAWVAVIAAFLTSLGVYAVPNQTKKETP